MKIIMTAVLFCASLMLHAQFSYPATKAAVVSDTYFGVTYNDPYRWLENISQPEVVDWFKQQANYSNAVLNKLNGRDELIAEWKMLDRLQPARIRSVAVENNKYFYRKTLPGESVGKLYTRTGIAGEETLLFDPLNYIAGKPLTISYAIPSYDGKKIAIAYTQEGAEVDVLKVMDVDTKTFLKDSIFPSVGFGAWTFDSKGFYYGWIKSADNKDPESRLNSKMKYHLAGSDQTADKDFFSNEKNPELKIDAAFYPYVYLSKDSKKYIFGGAGSVQPEIISYYAPIGQLNAEIITWKPLSVVADKLVRSFGVIGDDVFGITYNGALNYKLVSTNLKNTDWSKAKTIAAERPNETLENFINTKDYLLIVHSDGINNRLSKYNLKTKATSEVKLPYSGSINVFCINTATNDCTLGITSWAKPYTEYNLNAVTDIISASSFNKAPEYPAAYKDLEVKEVEVKGHDGAMIPLSIIYKKGTKLDGSNICYLNAYGAYGSSSSPGFDVRESTMAVKGVVIGIPHVRGGSEKGEAWYRAGYKTTKPNTWKDFISCAEYMIEKGYTSKGKLAGGGTSAGGILISRAITERPDLFTAAICNVGCANAMRLEFGANGPVNIPEFGTVKDEIECKALYEMDGMQHVQKGTAYPAVISVAGWNDSRVVAWQPGKFAAALQNNTSSNKPVLMKVNYDNGHFTEDKNVTFSNFADQYAFVLWQCGHPEFQLKK